MTTSGAAAGGPAARVVDADARARERTAALRCACYGAWSDLTASPHEVDSRETLREKRGAGTELGYGAALDELIDGYQALDRQQLRREYSGLFEVGSDGPPVPIREDLQTGQRAGTREDLVRFYDYFGYALAEGFAWQPDHLSVELEFMHYLCYREASADAGWLSYQLAQRDFAGRHLVNWTGGLAAEARRLAGDAFYPRLLAALHDFLRADYEWQDGTISAAADS